MTNKRIKKSRRARDFDEAVSRRALAELLAEEAARLPLVTSFREGALHGELLRASALDEWVRARHAEDRKKGLRLSRLSTSADDIEYGRNGVQAVFPRGTLDRLRPVVDHLQIAYAWQKRDATNFVLTGAVPPVPSLTIRYTQRFRYPRLSRITLEVDPSVGPREVMQEYRRVRAHFIQSRTRRIGVKSAEVVLFHLERQKKQPDSTWREEMMQWNRRHRGKPDFRFRQEQTYALYFNRAKRNLLMADSQTPKRTRRKK